MYYRSNSDLDYRLLSGSPIKLAGHDLTSKRHCVTSFSFLFSSRSALIREEGSYRVAEKKKEKIEDALKK